MSRSGNYGSLVGGAVQPPPSLAAGERNSRFNNLKNCARIGIAAALHDPAFSFHCHDECFFGALDFEAAGADPAEFGVALVICQRALRRRCRVYQSRDAFRDLVAVQPCEERSAGVAG